MQIRLIYAKKAQASTGLKCNGQKAVTEFFAKVLQGFIIYQNKFHVNSSEIELILIEVCCIILVMEKPMEPRIMLILAFFSIFVPRITIIGSDDVQLYTWPM